jgi:hypothetical protein
LKDAFVRFENGFVLEGVVLALAGLEHALRVLFCRVNKCPDLQLTADSVTLYTTMEMFVRPFYRDKEDENMLVELLGEAAMVAMIFCFFFFFVVDFWFFFGFPLFCCICYLICCLLSVYFVVISFVFLFCCCFCFCFAFVLFCFSFAWLVCM